jgi:hypothetical protein
MNFGLKACLLDYIPSVITSETQPKPMNLISDSSSYSLHSKLIDSTLSGFAVSRRVSWAGWLGGCGLERR